MSDLAKILRDDRRYKYGGFVIGYFYKNIFLGTYEFFCGSVRRIFFSKSEIRKFLIRLKILIQSIISYVFPSVLVPSIIPQNLSQIELTKIWFYFCKKCHWEYQEKSATFIFKFPISAYKIAQNHFIFCYSTSENPTIFRPGLSRVNLGIPI